MKTRTLHALLLPRDAPLPDFLPGCSTASNEKVLKKTRRTRRENTTRHEQKSPAALNPQPGGLFFVQNALNTSSIKGTSSVAFGDPRTFAERPWPTAQREVILPVLGKADTRGSERSVVGMFLSPKA